MTNIQAYAGTQAVVRCLRLLKLFHAAPELSLAQLRERSGLNRSTAFRILTALESEGMIERDVRREVYRLGPQIAALGRRAAGEGDLRELARREMESLALRLHETVTIETLAASDVVIVGEAMGDRVLGMLPSLGTSWPAHATSTGKVLLAALAPAERDRLLRGRLRAVTPRTTTTKRALTEELERVRARGWAASVEELEPGFVAVAVPVVDANGRTLAALSLGGPKHRLPDAEHEALARELARSAAAITAELGG